MKPEQNLPTSVSPVGTTTTTTEPDLLDRIFDFLQAELHQAVPVPVPARLERIKARTRAEFGGCECYILRTDRDRRVSEILRLFNGRNAAEVASLLNIDRATVYRVVKRAKCSKPSRPGKS